MIDSVEDDLSMQEDFQVSLPPIGQVLPLSNQMFVEENNLRADILPPSRRLEEDVLKEILPSPIQNRREDVIIRDQSLPSPAQSRREDVLMENQDLPSPMDNRREDVLPEDNFNSKFKLNDRVKVMFESGYYYGNIIKFNDDILRTVRFDDGEVNEDVNENELVPVRPRTVIPDRFVLEPTVFKRSTTRSRNREVEHDESEIYFLEIQEEF